MGDDAFTALVGLEKALAALEDQRTKLQDMLNVVNEEMKVLGDTSPERRGSRAYTLSAQMESLHHKIEEVSKGIFDTKASIRFLQSVKDICDEEITPTGITDARITKIFEAAWRAELEHSFGTSSSSLFGIAGDGRVSNADCELQHSLLRGGRLNETAAASGMARDRTSGAGAASSSADID